MPASSIFCLPILPQRGITVASSVSVAQEWTMLRGPTDVQQVLRIVGMRRIFHRVQVIEVAEEFIEAVDGGQELIEIAEVVLAELAGGVALRFERGGNRAGLRRNADLGARLADRGHAGADGQLARDEVRAPRRATRFGVVVGEEHAFLGHLIEGGRSAGHQAAVVGADVPHADVIAHDEEDVGFLVLRKGTGR